MAFSDQQGDRVYFVSWQRSIEKFLDVALTLLLVGLLALPLLSRDGAFLGQNASELPVKIWVHETFARVGILGGVVRESAFPMAGALNNPDPVGAAITGVFQGVLGRSGAYNLLVLGQILLNAWSAYALSKELLGERAAAWTAAVAYGWMPLTLTYGVASEIADILNLWPYPFAIL